MSWGHVLLWRAAVSHTVTEGLTSNAKFGQLLHLAGADLDLQREQRCAAERKHCGVQRLQAAQQRSPLFFNTVSTLKKQ